MTDLLGRSIAPVVRQGDLLAGPAGLGVEAVCRVVAGVAYVRTETGYYVRADGTGPLLLDLPTGKPPLEHPEKTGEI